MTLSSILKQAKELYAHTPQQEKQALSLLAPTLKKIQQSIPQAKVLLGGSAAKGTWLKAFDVDVFVMFPYKKYENKSDELSNILEKGLKKKFKTTQRLHGSRDYFRISEAGHLIEVVPILHISKAKQAKNITDISPLHSIWVRKHKHVVNEIRLTKQFCKANNLYGAESYIRGFSGYICEILTIHYGSFAKLLKAATTWKEGTVIDTQGHYKKKDVFLEMNKSKLVSPLIVVDPVQHDRNAAAALSKEKFDQFIIKASEFLKKPSLEFFKEKSFAKDDLKKEFKNKKIILIHLKPQEGKEDIVGAKMMKIFEHVQRELRRHGFHTLNADWKWQRGHNAILIFVLENKPLPKTMEQDGPPLAAKQHVENFRKLHKKIITKHNRLVAIEQRIYLLPEQLLANTIKDAYVKERVRSARVEVC